ncbi:AbgT family transporter [Clostridium transplantifaecale]|uniref:AbgT family transporter n=1 Tax=Clostridium transplantifaecale TaxID=2479838 RepID=UPI000F62FE0A|nr:AbgT family transporter [Clostridium transplantifaecale]
MKGKAKKKKGSFLQKMILACGRAGDRLPHPAILYCYVTVFFLIVAHVLNGTTFQIPGQESVSTVTTLLSRSGLEYILTKLFSNFSGMSILPILIVMAAAVGIGEASGFWEALVIKCFKKIPDRLLVFLFLLVCINGNLMSDASLIIFPVLGAMLFQSRNRNPLLGITLAYGGYLCGLSANLFLASTDANVTAVTNDVLPTLEITKDLTIHMASNYYFMAASAIVLAVVGTFITKWVVEPAINSDTSIDCRACFDPASFEGDSPEQSRGLRLAGIVSLCYVVLVLAMVIPPHGLLRNAETFTILPKSPFMSSIVPLLAILFGLAGAAYGYGAKTVKRGTDIINAMGNGIKSIANVLVVFFIAAQFINYLTKTNLAAYFAVSGANWLAEKGLTGIPLIIALIILVSIINIFAGSVSTKWAMIAGIIVPMMALLGYHPAYAQCIYRVGDALTNSVNPIFYYLPLILGVVQKYKKDAGIGTVVAYQIPYFIGYSVIWTLMLILWYVMGWNVGPMAPVML